MAYINPDFPEHGEPDWDEPLLTGLAQMVGLANVHDDAIASLARSLATIGTGTTSPTTGTGMSTARQNADGTWTVRFALASAGGVLPTLANLSIPVITGVFQPGSVLSVAGPTWSSVPDSFAYQWYRDGLAISGASLATYAPTTADVGHNITVNVSGFKTGYIAGTILSGAITIVPAPTPSFTNYGSPVINGSLYPNSTLTVAEGSWNPIPDNYYYQWLRNGSPISGAVSRTYSLTTADVGKQISVQVTGTKSGYTTAVANSAYVVPVASLVVGTAAFSGGSNLILSYVVGAPTGNRILTESGNTLTTEAGDRLVFA